MKPDTFQITVRDPNLAGALASVGVPPDPRKFEDSFYYEPAGRKFACWHFLDRTADGLDLTAELIRAWEDPEAFNAKYPTHRFSYIMIAMKNARLLAKRAGDQKPIFMLRKGKQFALVDPAAEQVIQDEVLMKIGI